MHATLKTILEIIREARALKSAASSEAALAARITGLERECEQHKTLATQSNDCVCRYHLAVSEFVTDPAVRWNIATQVHKKP